MYIMYPPLAMQGWDKPIFRRLIILFSCGDCSLDLLTNTGRSKLVVVSKKLEDDINRY